MDSKLIETWFNNLNWGPDKVAAERVQILKTGNMGFTTEVSGCWSCIHEIYESVINRIRTEFPHADDITMLAFCRTRNTRVAQPAPTARTSS